MSRDTRNALIASAVILGGFAAAAFFLPRIMLAAGEASPWLAMAVVIVFLLVFFVVFWLRSRYQHRRER